MRLSTLSHLARPPHGLLHREDLHRAGVSRHAWRRAITAGSLVEVMPGVAAIATRPITHGLRVAAAVISAGPGAIASHRTAALIWGVEAIPQHPIDIIRTAPGGRPGELERFGVVAHRPRDLLDLEPVVHRGQCVTSPVRTLLDLGAVMHSDVERALQHMLIARLVTHQQVEAAIIRHSRPGRHGIVALRTSLERQYLDQVPPDSILEEHLARLIARFQLPTVQFHHRLGGYTVDGWIVDTCLYIECDGWAVHGLQRDQFEFDRRRTADLSALGYVGIRVTWRQVIDTPREVAESIHDNVRRWAPLLMKSRRSG